MSDRNQKNDLFHILNCLESIARIQNYNDAILTPEQFLEQDDQLIFNASLTLLMNVGESINKLSDESRIKLDLNHIQNFRAIRNRIAHDYAGINSFIVFEVIKEHLPILNSSLDNLLQEMISNDIFDMDEFNSAVSSSYYKHLDLQKYLKQ